MIIRGKHSKQVDVILNGTKWSEESSFLIRLEILRPPTSLGDFGGLRMTDRFGVYDRAVDSGDLK